METNYISCCSLCMKYNATEKCSICNINYCSKKCQLEDSEAHKKACAPIRGSIDIELVSKIARRIAIEAIPYIAEFIANNIVKNGNGAAYAELINYDNLPDAISAKKRCVIRIYYLTLKDVLALPGSILNRIVGPLLKIVVSGDSNPKVIPMIISLGKGEDQYVTMLGVSLGKPVNSFKQSHFGNDSVEFVFQM